MNRRWPTGSPTATPRTARERETRQPSIPARTVTQQRGLDACRSIADDRERLACYNALAGDNPSVSNPAPPASISAESLFGRDAAQTGVSGVEIRADGKQSTSLQNDQRWEQIDGRPLRLVSGDLARIRKSSFGSYLLYKHSGGRSIRVRRVD